MVTKSSTPFRSYHKDIISWFVFAKTKEEKRKFGWFKILKKKRTKILKPDSTWWCWKKEFVSYLKSSLFNKQNWQIPQNSIILHFPTIQTELQAKRSRNTYLGTTIESVSSTQPGVNLSLTNLSRKIITQNSLNKTIIICG